MLIEKKEELWDTYDIADWKLLAKLYKIGKVLEVSVLRKTLQEHAGGAPLRKILVDYLINKLASSLAGGLAEGLAERPARGVAGEKLECPTDNLSGGHCIAISMQHPVKSEAWAKANHRDECLYHKGCQQAMLHSSPFCSPTVPHTPVPPNILEHVAHLIVTILYSRRPDRRDAHPVRMEASSSPSS